MPHTWTIVFDAAPRDKVPDIDLQGRKVERPAGMVMLNSSIKFELQCDNKDYEHDGARWQVARIIDPFAHLPHHASARASAVDQRGDLADEHELLKMKLAKAPPPHVMKLAEDVKQEKLREVYEHFKERSFLLGTSTIRGRDAGTRGVVPSKEKQAEMREEAKEAYDEYLEEWAEEETEKMEKDVKLKLGVNFEQGKKGAFLMLFCARFFCVFSTVFCANNDELNRQAANGERGVIVSDAWARRERSRRPNAGRRICE